jgi:hypothetical protein
MIKKFSRNLSIGLFTLFVVFYQIVVGSLVICSLSSLYFTSFNLSYKEAVGIMFARLFIITRPDYSQYSLKEALCDLFLTPWLILIVGWLFYLLFN